VSGQLHSGRGSEEKNSQSLPVCIPESELLMLIVVIPDMIIRTVFVYERDP